RAGGARGGRMRRRQFIIGGMAAAGAFLTEAWRPLLAATPGPGPYGPLGPVDANGLQLPAGFTSRVIGRTGAPVAGTTTVWHAAPDGGSCFATPDGGWVYVSSSEVGSNAGARRRCASRPTAPSSAPTASSRGRTAI